MQNAEIFFEHEAWKGPLAWSALLHAAFFGGLLFYAAVIGSLHGESWGGSGSGGDALSVTLVSRAAVPLPPPSEESQSVVANESKGLSESEKQQPETGAIALPEHDATKPEKNQRKAVMEKPRPANQIPFGQGGPVSGPYGVFNANGAKGGLSLTGGGGDFGSRYGWYVDVVRRKVAENWLKYEVDPSISSARRVYITFEITRSGEPVNIQLSQSSGIPSLDQSAVRALERIDTFGSLPPDYPGSRVSVEFWFDYRR
ncbi:MAG: energy transducer TonB [Terriglobales bacterium]